MKLTNINVVNAINIVQLVNIEHLNVGTVMTQLRVSNHYVP